MGFCPYITARLLDSSVVDGTTTMYSYSVSQYDCPQNNICQVWDGNDCGSKNPLVAAAGPSPTSLLTEFLNKTDSDNLDLTSLGISGGIYGHDYMIDDPDNIPIILKAANEHQDFDETLIINRIEGDSTASIEQPGWDSTAEWTYKITSIDGTSDFITSLVTDSMYVVIYDGETFIGSYPIESSSVTSTTVIINLGFSDSPPLVEEYTYGFIIDRKRILWQEYLDLFGE